MRMGRTFSPGCTFDSLPGATPQPQHFREAKGDIQALRVHSGQNQRPDMIGESEEVAVGLFLLLRKGERDRLDRTRRRPADGTQALYCSPFRATFRSSVMLVLLIFLNHFPCIRVGIRSLYGSPSCETLPSTADVRAASEFPTFLLSAPGFQLMLATNRRSPVRGPLAF
jgi:hypothetical protein